VKFGIFYEHQMGRPWEADGEHRLIQDALEQVELADRLGIDYVWEVEHHFLEEYSHSSAPEIFLAAVSQRTKRMRLGHGIVQTPPAFNHPARVAERIATLDLVSRGRVDFGTGESSLSYLREFSLSIFLYSPGAEPLGPLLYHFYVDGNLGPMCSLALLVSVVCMVLIVIARKVGNIGDAMGH
jgi:hypothetical protein